MKSIENIAEEFNERLIFKAGVAVERIKSYRNTPVESVSPEEARNKASRILGEYSAEKIGEYVQNLEENNLLEEARELKELGLYLQSLRRIYAGDRLPFNIRYEGGMKRI